MTDENQMPAGFVGMKWIMENDGNGKQGDCGPLPPLEKLVSVDCSSTG